MGRYYALNAQAGVDGDARFLWLALDCAGATHDALALATSGLYAMLQSGRIPTPYFILGDDAYSGSHAQIVTPFAGKNLPHNEDTFNFYQSSLRCAQRTATHAQQASGGWTRVGTGGWALTNALSQDVGGARLWAAGGPLGGVLEEA